MNMAPSLPKQQPSLGAPGRAAHRDSESHVAVECESRPKSPVICPVLQVPASASAWLGTANKATSVCAGGTLPDVFFASTILDSSLRLAGPFQELGLSLPVVSYLKGDSHTVGAPSQTPRKHKPCPNTCFYREFLY